MALHPEHLDLRLEVGVHFILQERGDRLVSQGDVGYVVIDSRFIPPDRARWVIDALRLVEIQRDQHLTLYAPEANRPQ